MKTLWSVMVALTLLAVEFTAVAALLIAPWTLLRRRHRLR